MSGKPRRVSAAQVVKKVLDDLAEGKEEYTVPVGDESRADTESESDSRQEGDTR